jgi:hypothetical protein
MASWCKPSLTAFLRHVICITIHEELCVFNIFVEYSEGVLTTIDILSEGPIFITQVIFNLANTVYIISVGLHVSIVNSSLYMEPVIQL